MTIIQAILLGALQGLAEFLPMSSSGHLKVCQTLFNLNEVPLLYDISLHIATLVAVCIYFRKTIKDFFVVLFRWIFNIKKESKFLDYKDLCDTEENGRKTIIAILITTIVTGVIGIVTSKFIPEMNIKYVFIGFSVTAFILMYSEQVSKKNASAPYNGISIKQALIIGVMQGVGTLPGISRSGSTIAGALFCGVNRALAGVYSFIVSIPAILGAFVLELKDLDKVGSSIGISCVLAGCVSAFIVGYFSLALLMKLIKKGKLSYFSIYLIVVSVIGIIFVK